MFNLFSSRNAGNVFGLDIGYETLKLCQIKQGAGSVSVLGLNDFTITERILDRDRIKNKTAAANIINEARRKAKPHPITATRIITALPETFVFSKTIQVPKMSPKELDNAIPNEAAQYLPIPLGEVYIDYQVLITHPDESLIDVLVAATPKQLVEDYVEMAKMANLELAALETKPIADGRAIIAENDQTGNVIVHIGTEVCRISIWDYGKIRLVSTVSSGKNQILDQIGVNSKDLGNIEKMSLKDIDLKSIPSIKAIIDELIEAIRYHQNRSYKPAPIKSIQICGSAAQIPGLEKIIENETKIKSQIAKPLKLSANIEPQFITSYGLSMREM